MNFKSIRSKTLLFIVVISSCLGSVFAQNEGEEPAKTSLYLELGGAAGIWSFNYDRTLWDISKSFKLNGRAGFGLLSEFNGAGFPDVLIPVSGAMLYGKDKHRIELGGGITYFNWTMRDPESSSGYSRKPELLKHLILGYRFQKMDGGLMFRIIYSPIISNESNENFGHWMGVSIGKTIKRKTKSKPSI